MQFGPIGEKGAAVKVGVLLVENLVDKLPCPKRTPHHVAPTRFSPFVASFTLMVKMYACVISEKESSKNGTETRKLAICIRVKAYTRTHTDRGNSFGLVELRMVKCIVEWPNDCYYVLSGSCYKSN